MQTFLPYPNFIESAKVLDRQRLGKQRVEVLQILKTLNDEYKSGAWRNHPAVRMWRGYEKFLVYYGLAICHEWTSRGYRDTCASKILDYYPGMNGNGFSRKTNEPFWLGGKIHESHRSVLIRKDSKHYGPLFKDTPNNLNYYWPV